MNKVVLDSSAVLALIGNEVGADVVRRVIFYSVISSVNLAEIRSKLADRGKVTQQAGASVVDMLAGVEPFTRQHAYMVGTLREGTRAQGLSIGDRACLALAISLGCEVYTADQAWRDIQVGCKIHFIRPRRAT